MKKYIAFALLLPLFLKAQDNAKACDIFSKINNVLQKEHINPKPTDDSLSVYVFNTVIENLDEDRVLFLEEDIKLLAKHKYAIDNYLTNGNCSFFSDFTSTYRKALQRHKKLIQEIEREALTFKTKDTLYYSRESFPYHTTEADLKKHLRKRIAYEVLEDIARQGTNRDSLKAVIATAGKASKAKITDALLCQVNTQLEPAEGFEQSIYNEFFSVFCSYFDPHSTYFNYSEKAEFVSSISSENYSLGLYVSHNENEEVVVEEVVPGGPAYKTRKIDKGDQIVKLASNEREYNVTCASMDAINDIVFSDSYKVVELTLRKKDGTVYSVSLEKKIMKADDHSVYGFVLGTNNPVGYIKIPGFYTAFDSNGEKGCADDVAMEVMKLKKEGIKGLILDLQFNGGGSIDEVIKMAGMFIDYGPLSIFTDRNKAHSIVKDYNRGELYNGPMVVIVNGLSASASEFFAGVMQDYGRALIVGNTTLGKATMQTIVPLDDADDRQDFVKVTIDKFYRITGKSSQYLGIQPDIMLPAFFDKFLPRESSMPTAIKNDSITLTNKFRPWPAYGYKEAIANSTLRISENSTFKQIVSVNTLVEALYLEDKTPLPLTFDAVFDDVHDMDAIWKDIKTASETESSLTVKNTITAAVQDEYEVSAFEYRVKQLKTDPYVFEAVNIINDLCSYKVR